MLEPIYGELRELGSNSTLLYPACFQCCRASWKGNIPLTTLVIAAFDGLLPQQVNASLTPTVHALASRGVRFTRHHSVFPTVTRVNSAAMVTGCYPGKHGIAANTAVFPDHDPYSVMSVLQPELDAMAANPNTPVLFVPTIGEILASAGMSHVSIVGGSSGNAYVHFPQASSTGRGGVIHPEFSLPAALGKAEAELLGPWPDASVPGIERIRRVTESACRFVIPEINPDLLFVWFPEPDGANHAHGIGSDQASLGIAEADAAMSKILDLLTEQGDDPDVIVISDHGYSTISDAVNVNERLSAAGFSIDQGDGSVLVGNNGGSVLLNYPGATNSDIELLMNWLHSESWAGAIFSSLEHAQALGALSTDEVFANGPRVPHFIVSMAWKDQSANNGFDGTAWNGSNSPIGAGLHGSSSPFELRNTLIASGPSFKKSSISSVPSGNVDLTPTALTLLGLTVPPHMDGRALHEALVDGPDPEELTVEQDVSHGAAFPSGIDSVGQTRYAVQKVKVNGHTYIESAGVQVD